MITRAPAIPNSTNLEETLSALEDAKFATVFSSGLSAITAVVMTLRPGDTVLASNDVYGGTYRLIKKVFEPYGIRLEQTDTSDGEMLEKAIEHVKPKILLIETPSNPLLFLANISAAAKIAKKHGVLLVVDNTFATPYLQQPLALGADVVIHSTTKYLGGHSDIIGGALITNDAVMKEHADFTRKAIGMNPSPFDAWLTSRGIKTLALRMDQHCRGAAHFAEWLSKHPQVKRVYYPGLSSHPHHDVAKSQMSQFGGMVSVEFALDLEQTMELISSFNVFTLAESLGGVESLVEHPASMTHASIPPQVRRANGLEDGLVRFSIGIEDPEDLIEDVAEGLKRTRP